MLLKQGLIFPFYSSVIAASSDHPETKKAKRSLDNLEVYSFFIFLFTESILYYAVDMLAGMLTNMVDMLTISHYID